MITLELSFYENTALIICVVLYVGSVIVYVAKKFWQERKLAKSEIIAQLDMLDRENDKKKEARDVK